MKTSELTGAALDWAVAKCDGVVAGDSLDVGFIREGGYSPSTDWAQGGPIIEREKIGIDCDDLGTWFASYDLTAETAFGATGTTLLIAAMRCYVASKLGDTVDVPEKLKAIS